MGICLLEGRDFTLNLHSKSHLKTTADQKHSKCPSARRGNSKAVLAEGWRGQRRFRNVLAV